MSAQAFDWSKYLELADELANRPEESCRRTAIGRAYYYAFHLARQRIVDNQFTIIMGADSHKQVWEKFDNSPDSSCKKLYNIAKFLKERRQRADYEPLYVRIEEDLPLILEKTRKFAEDLSKLNPRLPANTGVRR